MCAQARALRESTRWAFVARSWRGLARHRRGRSARHHSDTLRMRKHQVSSSKHELTALQRYWPKRTWRQRGFRGNICVNRWFGHKGAHTAKMPRAPSTHRGLRSMGVSLILDLPPGRSDGRGLRGSAARQWPVTALVAARLRSPSQFPAIVHHFASAPCVGCLQQPQEQSRAYLFHFYVPW